MAEKLDLPGGTIEFCEKPSDALKRELKEEVGIDINKFELFDADSVSFEWDFKDKKFMIHHIGVFYKILDYSNEIKNTMEIDEQNDDSLGAKFYDINNLTQLNLSKIALMELEKMGYQLK